MTTTALKKQIYKNLETIQDHELLFAIQILLLKAVEDKTLKGKLTKRALKSELDITKGKVFDYKQVLNRIRK